MKPSRLAFPSLLIVLSVSLLFTCSVSEPYQERKLDLWLVLRLRDYETDMPIPDTSVTATVSWAWRDVKIGPLFTNETGIIQVFLGEFADLHTSTPSRLQELGLSSSFTAIKVHDSFIEDEKYSAEYVANYTRYEGMGISLARRNVENRSFIEANIWVLKGKLVRVSDGNPISGVKESLSIKPAVKAVIEDGEEGQYEALYLFPLDYDTTIVHQAKSKSEEPYPVLRVKAEENTTLINWMYHAAREHMNRETLCIDKEMSRLSSFGFILDREAEEYRTLKNLLNRVLYLYEEGDYSPALGGARISADRLNDLRRWISNLTDLAQVTSVFICLFAYGLASVLSNFFYDEPSENKIRLVCKVLMFSSLMVMFSVTHPSLKITYATIIERLVGGTTPGINLPITFLGCFVVGSMTYFFIALLSIRKTPMTELAFQLGVRSLKRRASRTLLTLITITIIVSSAIVFVNISATRSTRTKGSWMGTDVSAVLIQSDVNLAPLSEYDINWTRKQDWCKDLGYTEEIRRSESLGAAAGPQGSAIQRIGILQLSERSIVVDIVGLDPMFMEKYYDLSKYIRGFWQDFSIFEPVVILPTSIDVPTGEYVTLAIRETDGMSAVRTLGSFRVVGKFDPGTISKLTKIDNSPLFKRPFNLVMVPIKAIRDPSMVISEVTITTKEEADPMSVAEELAYTLGVATVANKDGLAVRIEWSLELSIVGLTPYLFPLAISGLMVYITMASVYEERKKEFTTLATLGLDPGNTFRIFIVEALLLGLMGTFLSFFGSYILVIISYYLLNLLGFYRVPTLSLSYAYWSMPAILVALFTGVVMVFLGGYVPAARAQSQSLMGRVKRRRLVGELISEGDTTSFTLPIRTTVQNGEMLYRYVRETIGKVKSSLVDPHSVKGEIRRDGTFIVSFYALGAGQSVFVPCEVKGIREGESLVPVIEFPSRHKDYAHIRDILRDLEEYMIGFSAWKEIQLKMKVIREAPRRRKTSEEILAEIKDIISQIRDSNKKLKILDSQKDQLSEEVYEEFRDKYTSKIDGLSKGLRSMAIGLEPHHNELQQEIKKLEVEVERITIAYNLGEVNEEEYVKTCGPLQGRLATLKSEVQELEEIFDFLKTPSRLT